MSEIINGHRAIELLQDVIAGREEFVYEGIGRAGQCLYVENGQPSCVVGHVLHRAGWTVEELSRLDPDGKTRMSTNAVHLDTKFPGRIDADAAHVLAAAQYAQDDQNTWGEALEEAENQWHLIQRDVEEEEFPRD